MTVKKKFDVFLSHNSKDKPWVINLKTMLQSHGIKVWLDKDEIRPGDLFAEALEKGIKESKAVALIISPDAMNSGWVKAEYYRALSLATNNQLQLIPVPKPETSGCGLKFWRNRTLEESLAMFEIAPGIVSGIRGGRRIDRQGIKVAL